MTREGFRWYSKCRSKERQASQKGSRANNYTRFDIFRYAKSSDSTREYEIGLGR